MKITTTLASLAVTGLALAILPAGAANADDTTTTFTLSGGSLDIDVAATAALVDGAHNATTISGPLGGVLVTDERGSTAAWSVTASTTGFAGPSGSASTDVKYATGVLTAGGIGEVTPTTPGEVDIDSANAVVNGTLVRGDNTVSFSPVLTVTLADQALAGLYTGTVVTSVA